MEHAILTDEMIDELAGSADDAVVAVSADELRRNAEQARDAALRKIRDLFHARWGWFVKCRACGGRIEFCGARTSCTCGSRTFHATGYAR